MGTTIKRQPINFKIPDSPDYKYLNITDFRGVHISDNPFESNSNTASDSLNLYVDESNTLTTRPRLELFQSFRERLNIEILIGVYNLSNGLIIHHKNTRNFTFMSIYNNDGTITEITTDGATNIPATECNVFEQNGVIYLLTGEYYLKIQNNILSKVSGYVPTVRVGKNATYVDENGEEKTNEAGAEYESLNLLTDEYKETYFWNGNTNPYKLDISGDVEIKSDFVKRTGTLFYTFESAQEVLWLPLKYLPDYYDSDNGYNTQNWLVSDLETTQTLGILTDKETNSVKRISPPNNLPQYYDFIKADASNDGKTIACVYVYIPKGPSDITDSTTNVGGVYLYSGDVVRLLSETTDQFITYDSRIPTASGHRIRVNSNGDVIATYTQKNVIIWKNVNGSYERFSIPIEYTHPEGYNVELYPSGLELSDNGDVVVIKCDTLNHGLTNESRYFGIITNVLNATDSSQLQIQNMWSGVNPYSNAITLSPKGDLLAYKFSTGKNLYILNITTNKVSSTELLNYDGTSDLELKFSSSGNKIYYTSSKTSGWVMSNNLTVVPYDFADRGGYLPVGNTQIYATDSEIFLFEYRYDYRTTVTQYRFDVSGKEPTVIVTKKLSVKDGNYNTWSEQQTLFNKAKLTKRFQNNRWFASQNTTYYTQNNDPTYIPLNSYHELDDSEETVTGFNIVEDNTLVIYKKASLYVVQPITINNQFTFTYTITKNTTGNDGWNAPIVTSLTEIPLHVSYDGVFALNQLTNVQSSDRIAVLYNESINQKWLNESTKDKDNSITLNRLYWTYFILPSSELTKIYLLDNRNHTWFYWELPIVTKNAFVKDGVVCFVNTDADVFKLKTSDVLNEFNPNLTEYYDHGHRQISWKWRSQILPLGTINYTKKLISTTFVFTDTDSTDEYSLNYKFNVFRKQATMTAPITITNKLNYVQSTTKKTFIPKFNFIQIEISNTEDDLNNNKLRLVGMGLKYELLGGML